jgi:hypothetical protein
MAQGCGDVVVTVVPQQADYSVAESRPGLRRRATAPLTGVLPQGHSAHLIQSVLDGLVLADPAQELACGHRRLQTREEGAHEPRGLASMGPAPMGHRALQLPHLLGTDPSLSARSAATAGAAVRMRPSCRSRRVR